MGDQQTGCCTPQSQRREPTNTSTLGSKYAFEPMKSKSIQDGHGPTGTHYDWVSIPQHTLSADTTMFAPTQSVVKEAPAEQQAVYTPPPTGTRSSRQGPHGVILDSPIG